MRARTPAFALVVTLTVGVALTGCVSGIPDPTPSATTSVPDPDASPSITRNPAESDSILWIRALATAPNGAHLSLEAMVHRSLSYEYQGSQTLNQILIDDCGASLTNAIIYADSWSISRMNVTAIPPAGSPDWPTDQRVGVRPSADVAYMGGRGILQADPTTGDLACRQDKVLAAAGRGALAVGFPRDTIDLDHFSNGWAHHTWGFTALDGVVLSDCSFELTDLGGEVGGGAADWVQTSNSSSCFIGPTTEAPTF